MNKDELNYIVLRYLEDSGYHHSAYVFASETGIEHLSTFASHAKTNNDALVTLVQKGVQFCELEECINQSNSSEQPLKKQMKIEPVEQQRATFSTASFVLSSSNRRCGDVTESTTEANVGQLITLRGHESEVFTCAWHPYEDLLASGSGDSTSRVWNLTDMNEPTQLVLRHCIRKTIDPFCLPCNIDVTTVAWDPSGSLLATGSFDGYARIWSSDGQLRGVLGQHQGPIFSLKWNAKGNYILSAGDRSVIVWNICNGFYAKRCIGSCQLHDGRVLDVDWQSDLTFASCSADELIHVCTLGTNKPVRTFVGHKGEINAIKWDPQGQLLASCSDDKAVKIWCPHKDKCLFSLEAHSKEIYTICWAQTGPTINKPNGQLLLASASFESTVRVWEVQTGACIFVLTEHSEPVYSVAFSPDGDLLATGSFDKQIILWDVASGNLIQRYKCTGGVFDVRWNSRGDRIGACLTDGGVCVLDLKQRTV